MRSALGFEISTVLSSIDIALCDGWLQDDKAVEAGPKGMGGVTPGQHTGQATEPVPRATVRPVRVEVRGVRPRNHFGELHGIFYPRGPSVREATTARAMAAAHPHEPLIVLWMRTAQRHDVVKPKTFFRTLMHELGHYLDYALLRLEDSYHSSGFFKRESFLVRTLYRDERQRDE